MKKDMKYLYSLTVLAALGTRVTIALMVLSLFALWFGMLYATQIIFGVNLLLPFIAGRMQFIPVSVIMVMLGEGLLAVYLWVKAWDRIGEWKTT